MLCMSSEVKLYYNILTAESRNVSCGKPDDSRFREAPKARRRDKPLAVINEPIEDNKGGGKDYG